MIVASCPIKSVIMPKSCRGAACSRYPVLAVKNRGRRGILIWHDIITGINDRYSRGYIRTLLSGYGVAVHVTLCLCCFESANTSRISDNDKLYVANPGTPYPPSSPWSLLVWINSRESPTVPSLRRSVRLSWVSHSKRADFPKKNIALRLERLL